MKRIPVSSTARYLLAALLAAAVVLFLPATAQAHDELISHSPEQGEELEQMPDGVTLEFSGVPVALGSVVQIRDAAGEDWAAGDVEIVDTRVTQPIEAGAPEGTYTVNWRVVSSDSHPIEGTFEFTVGEAAPASPGPATTSTAAAGAGTAQPVETAQGNAADEPGTTVAGQSVPWSLIGMIAVLVALAVIIGVMAKRKLAKGDE
ncbi:copper resistance protein, CopC family [Arthrobacter crystallopoietes BAB-32]|uniref:Copper resistance protein, CopC family n=1 Tax=Arthrobacter crystallopoietes BAB-32 TaxID=1246476 RepID=N1V3Z7_9MICC|nr:copper resistance protein CopC [Arthrobacter crystallopoietes]EMY32973.1 copper resistance protein, CopC family [Arthrobacter crystallopoietes BAB-32]